MGNLSGTWKIEAVGRRERSNGVVFHGRNKKLLLSNSYYQDLILLLIYLSKYLNLFISVLKHTLKSLGQAINVTTRL